MQATFQSHPVFDNEDAIIKAGNCPSPVDLTSFQERINRIVGCTVENRPRVRIVWGQDLNVARHIILGEWRATYPFYRYEEGGKIHDIGTPRFYVEELHDVAELNAGDNWEKARYIRNKETGEIEADVLGPLPLEGFYTTIFMVAHHDDWCCKGAEIVKGEPCLGAFRVPTDFDLQRVRRMHQRRNNAARQDIAPSAALIAKRAADLSAAQDAERRNRVQAVVEDFLKTHQHRFTTFDPTELRWGKYHFMGRHSKAGGAPVEESNDSNTNSAAA